MNIKKGIIVALMVQTLYSIDCQNLNASNLFSCIINRNSCISNIYNKQENGSYIINRNHTKEAIDSDNICNTENNYSAEYICNTENHCCTENYTLQNASNNTDNLYNKRLDEAIKLYNSKIYKTALAEFEKLKDNSYNKYPDMITDGYIILCKIHLGDGISNGIEKEITSYAKQFSTSSLLNNIYYSYALLLFDNNDYKESLKYLELTDHVAKENMVEYCFKQAYCLMTTGNNNDAIKEFRKIIYKFNSKKYNANNYLKASEYYIGYILYSQENFRDAIDYFKKASEDSRFKQLSDFHIFECNFMLNNYKYVTSRGTNLYNTISDEYKPKVARMLSEAYYQEKNTEQAEKYFKLYQSSGIKLTTSDNFYAGIMSYYSKRYSDAIDNFKNVIEDATNKKFNESAHLDSLLQSAYYYSGNCYIQLNDKYAAREAFFNAAKVSVDKNITEDAYFNYAKLSFDLNRSVKQFNTYLQEYTYSQKKADEINNYIATAFLLEHNYTEAITALNKISNKNESVNNNIQKASFLRGIQIIDNGGYADAIPMFMDATEIGNNTNLSNLSNYWLAECLYRTDRFNESLAQINSLKTNIRFKRCSEYPELFFNSGYVHFKLSNYTDAVRDFNQFLYLTQDHPLTVEVLSRIADCHYMNKDYTKASEIYEKAGVINNYKDLYAPYQASICYGLISQNNKKIALLRDITDPKYSHNPYYNEAMYELGRTLVQTAKDEDAISVFNRLAAETSDSTYYYKSLLELGMIYSNLQQQEKALSYYKQIIENSPSSNETESALAGMETIYQSMNRSNEFIEYIDRVGLSSHKSSSEREDIAYNAAEQEYLNGNYSKALTSLGDFLNRYPDSKYVANANFYMGECLNKQGKMEAAIEAYKKVMEQGEGAFSELATLNFANLSYSLERYEDARRGYMTLDQIAKFDNNKLIAIQGVMNTSYQLKEYDSSISKANMILKKYPNLSNLQKEEINYILAKSYILNDEKDRGEKILKTLAKNANSDKGAEANYMLIKSAYDSGKFDNVETLAFSFSDTGTEQTYWLAKSFIILADSYLAKGDIEQAEATYNSIKDNYTPERKDDDILQQLEMRYKKLNEEKNR